MSEENEKFHYYVLPCIRGVPEPSFWEVLPHSDFARISVKLLLVKLLRARLGSFESIQDTVILDEFRTWHASSSIHNWTVTIVDYIIHSEKVVVRVVLLVGWLVVVVSVHDEFICG